MLARRLGWGFQELQSPAGVIAAQQRIIQMADIRARELQRARSRKHAARGDRTASVRLDAAQHDALLCPSAPEALRPLAGAGEVASL
eukprot:1534160-Alexandrium_andersonii.AAC.1